MNSFQQQKAETDIQSYFSFASVTNIGPCTMQSSWKWI